eukprot:2707492-Prymnesium_polylepis.1
MRPLFCSRPFLGARTRLRAARGAASHGLWGMDCFSPSARRVQLLRRHRPSRVQLLAAPTAAATRHPPPPVTRRVSCRCPPRPVAHAGCRPAGAARLDAPGRAPMLARMQRADRAVRARHDEQCRVARGLGQRNRLIGRAAGQARAHVAGWATGGRGCGGRCGRVGCRALRDA